MSESPNLDLAHASHWFGVRPGMTRAQALEMLEQQGVEPGAYGDDNVTATTDDWEMELYFATDGSERLRQVSIDGDIVVWKGTPLQGARLDDALRAMEPIGPAMWEANDVIGEPFPEPSAAPSETVSDEQLMEESTLWLAEKRLGLVICDGEVIGVAWREPQDFPRQFAGPLTDAQRELSRRPDLGEYLGEKRLERFRVATPKDPLSPLRAALTLLLIAALIWVGRMGFQEMLLWKNAEVLQAKFVAMEQVPLKQFREYVPPALRWAIPPSRRVMVEGYRVEFLDPHERRHEVVLERGELYVPPQKIGDEVPVAFVDGDPPRVKGLSRARDAAFLEFIPWVIALGVVYLLSLFALSLLRALWRFSRRVPRATS